MIKLSSAQIWHNALLCVPTYAILLYTSDQLRTLVSFYSVNHMDRNVMFLSESPKGCLTHTANICGFGSIQVFLKRVLLREFFDQLHSIPFAEKILFSLGLSPFDFFHHHAVNTSLQVIHGDHLTLKI